MLPLYDLYQVQLLEWYAHQFASTPMYELTEADRFATHIIGESPHTTSQYHFHEDTPIVPRTEFHAQVPFVAVRFQLEREI
jgi:hypothetical protein